MRINSYTVAKGVTLATLSSFGLLGCKSGGATPKSTSVKPAAVAAAVPRTAPTDSTDSTKPAPRPQQPGVPPVAQGPVRPGGAPGQPGAAPSTLKPYDQVITKEAVTKRGLFATHMIGTKLYFEIPKKELEKDLQMVGRYVKTRALGQDGPYAGDLFMSQTLRLTKRENTILVSSPNYNFFADSTQSISKAVEAANMAPIILTLPIASYGHDSSMVVEVTSLFTANPLFSAAGRGAQPDANRSFIHRAAAFPENVVVEGTQTGASQQGVNTVVGLWSIIKLPEHPMMPRLYDQRVGFFSVQRLDFGTNEHRAVQRRYINRWRLEKKNPNAAISEPIKPIVYYIDPNTPDQWKPFVRAGIEAWQVAFEAAGFKNAIIAKDVPTDDPDWSMEDNRNTVVRWLPSPVENAQGPHINDPRTGEILNGSIRMFHNILNLQRAWYFTQVGAVDSRAQTFPLPDSLMGKLLQYVVEHELGHTLGFPHNHKASSTYPIDSLRSVSWLKKMGHIPSLMDYARFNYLAQPEDKIPVDLLIPKVGPYDKFATMWGYKPIPGAKTPEDELKTLDSWARMQDTVPWYRFGNSAETGFNGNPDFGDAREAIGDIDAVKASTLGLKNIKRLIPMLIPTTVETGKSYADLAELYDRLLGQWRLEMGHVVNIIGGYETQMKYGGQKGAIYTPLSRARQVEAMKFITENVFKTPSFFIVPEISTLIHPEGATSRITNAQGAILQSLFDGSRINRLVATEAATSNTNDVYRVSELVYDIHNGVWGELKGSAVAIDVYRRSLQRAYLTVAGRIISPPAPVAAPAMPGAPAMPRPAAPAAPAELSAALRADLVDLRSEAKDAVGKVSDRETRAHLLYVIAEVDKILESK